MKISFKSLCEADFTLLLKWLEAPHVKAWWDQDIQWTPELIQRKYTDYVKGLKLEHGVVKPISAYIIHLDNTPIGYIQIYNAYDFARSKPLIGLPSSLAAFDIFIGEEHYLKNGIGSKVIVQFLKEHGDSYTHIFVDPENTNLAAIRAYEKAGFKKIKDQQDTAEIWMLLDQTSAIPKLIQQLETHTELNIMNISFEKANLSHVDIIFGWLAEPFVQEFWDNTQGHKDDILNFVNGRKEPSDYCDGKYVYWIASSDEHPFAMLMTIQETTEEDIDEIKLVNLSKTGHSYGIDYMIGDKAYFGKGYGARTLSEFIDFFIKEVDPKADTFLIDPASDNSRAKHVYMKAGFEHIADFVMSGNASGAGKPHHLLIKRFGSDPSTVSTKQFSSVVAFPKKSIIICPSQVTANRSNRLVTYSTVATELALLSDDCLAKRLEEATHIGTSIGGTAVLLNVCGTPIFVKKILLTDIEQLPENRMSTANLFDMPTFCQYGLGLDIGSPGFGAWRELAAHTMSTNWVLARECSNFPLMYHWRELPRSLPKPLTSEQLKQLEREVEYWEGSLAIRTRLEAKNQASAEIVLFLECFPEDLNTWFAKQIAEGGSAAESACIMVESNLKTITSFMNTRNLLHFDAHFRNILTDGHQLYFTDFGLATSTRFELSEVEAEFYKNHSTYDRCYIATHLVNWLIGVLFGAENRNTIIHEYATGIGSRTLGPVVESILTRYAPIAVVMNEFYRNFLTEARTTSYPSIGKLERLCAIADLLP